MSMPSHKRTLTLILMLILTLFGTLWTASAILAQPLPLPQPQTQTQPLSQPLPQILQGQGQNPTPHPQADPFAAAGSLTLTLSRTPAEHLEQVLPTICGHRFTVESRFQYVFTSNRNNVPLRCTLRIDPQARLAIFSGDKQLYEQVFQLLTAIDQPPPPGKDRQIIPYQFSSPEVLIRAFELSRLPAPKPQNNTIVQSNVVQNNVVQSNIVQASAVRQIDPNPDLNSNPVRQVNYQFEGGGFESGVVPAVPIPEMQPGFQPGLQQGFQPGFQQGMQQGMQPGFQQGSLPSVGLLDDYRYMFIPSLDLVVVEADGPRLRRFQEMIKQIEELSKINRPTIEVVYLEYVNNVALNEMLIRDRIYVEVFLTIPGSVRFIPMTSPNAIMLIGWGDAMDTAKELLQTLDKPTVTEHSRLHFFKPKHISATQARTTLASTFPPPTGTSGFMARIQLFADQRSNTLIVQAAPNELAEVKRVLEEIDVATSSVKMRVSRIILKNTLAPDLQQTLTQVISGSTPDNIMPSFELLVQGPEGRRLIESGILSAVTFTADVRNNALVVRAPEDSMPFIEELVALFDISSPEAVIKVFQIEHGDAESLVKMLKSLIPSNVEGTPGPQLPGGVDEDALIPIRFAVEVRTNCIVAAGSQSDLKIVEALLESLDREDLLSRRNFVYPLKNMKAVIHHEQSGEVIGGIATTINEYIRSRLELQSASQGVISPYQQIESAVIVIPAVESNSLIISATPRYYDEIIELIKELDKSPPQVVIQVLIAEITLSKGKEWASEIGFQDPLMFGRSTLASATNNLTTGGGLLFNNNASTSLGNPYGPAGAYGTVGTQMLSNFGAGRVGESGFGGLVFSANSEYINIMLRALQEDKRMEVLSSPKISTMNNQLAIVSSGQRVPRYQGVTTTNYGVTPNVSDVEVGLVLKVTPTISPEGTIVMKIILMKEKVGAESDGILVGTGDDGTPIRSPKIDKIEVGTTISAANNETVILGGLITREENKVNRKVPLLGDIPVIGKFWRQEISRTERKELLVILTPRIVEDSAEMARVKQMEMARMSWCLNNVALIHGDVGAYNVAAERPYTGDAPVISPGPVKMETLQPMSPQYLAPTLPKR